MMMMMNWTTMKDDKLNDELDKLNLGLEKRLLGLVIESQLNLMAKWRPNLGSGAEKMPPLRPRCETL